MSEREFETREGEVAAQAHNDEWLEPTMNPFGHGCCDCGLYHIVEWRLVDAAGNVVHDGHMKRFNLQLKFTRDEGETARLREYRRAAPVVREGLPPVSLKGLKEMWRKQDEEKEGE